VLLSAVPAVALVLLAAACGAGGVSSGGDTTRGKALFQQQCGACHTLADAGTRGTIGPNLDNAFASAREQGFAQSTMQQVVAGQIRFPLEPRKCPNLRSRPEGSKTACEEGAPGTPTGSAVMPANLVTGDDVNNVAAYVASVAGKPGGGGGGGPITTTDGKEIFLQAGCANCHTLKDAGSTGTVGPNLDQAKPSKALAVDRVTNGKGGMPPFKGQLTAKQIDAVAAYVSSVTGK
jgi:mono/diheme cytochrome c family protein